MNWTALHQRHQQAKDEENADKRAHSHLKANEQRVKEGEIFGRHAVPANIYSTKAICRYNVGCLILTLEAQTVSPRLSGEGAAG